MFRDRSDAGRRLAQKLLHLKHTRPVVLALPRGGVPVAFEISKAIEAPLELLLVRKIGAPREPELAVGAVVDGHSPERFINRSIVDALRVPPSYIEKESQRQLEEIERRRQLYLPGRSPVSLIGRTVIVVDDGIATGATVRVGLRALRDGGAAWMVLAAPVAPAEVAEELGSECDEAVFLLTPADFRAVGVYYDDFRQLDDAEVILLLRRAAE